MKCIIFEDEKRCLNLIFDENTVQRLRQVARSSRKNLKPFIWYERVINQPWSKYSRTLLRCNIQDTYKNAIETFIKVHTFEAEDLWQELL